ncbi:unnamed protein product [Paramecium pentaurelia]|uniref:Uncharacterized protein n=1 Tax=Paramecium pentaurelia TaxID=43138 RepID=A0A8S1T350_9CILI|nr:unnamed protein product [Paramecium pentaurelia]
MEKETSSVNTSHQQQQQQQNKEESKLKSLLQGSYDYIHRETGKMIQKKLYKRAFQLLEKFYHQRKDLELGEMVMLNRRIINCINKILKQGLLKPDIEQDRPEIMLHIFHRGSQAIFELYKYINLYIQKVIPNEMKGIVLEDVSHLTSSDEEDEQRIKEHEVTVLFYKINEYGLPKKEKSKKQVKELNPYEQEISESSRIANMVVKTVKPLNIQFELDQYFYNLIELQLMANLIFKKANKPKVAYYYLVEAQRIAKQILDTPNPNLVNACARVKIYFANYLYEISEYKESLRNAEEAIVILCGEMRIRINQEKFVQKKNKQRERRRMKRCVITTLSALITMMCSYEAENNYHRIVETLTTASWLAEKYIQGIDEFKKHIVKLASEGKHRLEQNLKDLADLSYIAESILDQELHKIRKTQRDQREQSESDYLKKFNSDMFNLFQVKSLNEQLYFKTQVREEQKKKQQFDNKIIEQSQPHGTDASINIFDSDSNSKDSFFEGSFFAPSIDNLQFDSKLFEEKRPQSVTRRPINRKIFKPNRQKGKSVGLIKIGLERPQDYKSRILTTTQYFNEYQKPKVQEEKNVSNTGALLKRQLENLEYREHPDRDEHHKQDLDVYVNKMVNGKIQSNEIRDYNDILGQLFSLRKKEDFDKKEFQFGRRMLNLKAKEEIMFYKESFKTPPVKVEIDTKVKDQAHIIDGKITAEKELKDLKRRKIDKMVAGKKIVQTNVNIDLKDPEETNYLKKVLEKSKKKKLKDLIYKHRESLGLAKFFANQLREMREKERILKLKSALEREISVDVADNQSQQQQQIKQKKNVKIVVQQIDKQQQTQQVSLQPSQLQQSQAGTEDPKIQGQISLIQQKSNSQTTLPKTILKRPKEISSVKESPQESQTLISMDVQGTDLILRQEKLQKAKRVVKDQIDKQQKKSHQVIGMIIDAVERKMDIENKELKKMLFKQKGGSKQYVDDDERTYLKFMPKFADMSRSTYLMYIKKELADKQIITLEDVVRANMNRKNQLADMAAQMFKDIGQHS